MAEPTSTSGAPKRRENLEAIVQANSPYHVQSWYKILKDHTFATAFIDLPIELAEALVEYKDKTVTDDAERTLARKFAPKVAQKTRERLLSQLDSIVGLIDAAAKDLHAAESGLFVRLSSRSPKDLISVRLYDTYLNELQQEVDKGANKDDKVLQKIVFTRASGRALRTVDGKDALALLVNSQRIYEDLAMSIKLHKQPEPMPWTQELVVRRWEGIKQEYEFRAFVYDGKMTACTQYYVGLYIPRLAAEKEEFARRIFSFWEKEIHPLLAATVKDYVIDFALDVDNNKIWVVEINNPPPVAGTALFDWNDPKDRSIIEGGPFEFRILDTAPEDPMKNQRDWLKAMEAQKQRAAKMASNESSKKKRLSF